MSDLASPFVVVTDADEVDAFWCFANFMREFKLVRVFFGFSKDFIHHFL
jgi:hypothetical protein